jgi:hypothetical protein
MSWSAGGRAEEPGFGITQGRRLVLRGARTEELWIGRKAFCVLRFFVEQKNMELSHLTVAQAGGAPNHLEMRWV